MPPGLGDLHRGRLADPRRGAGDHHDAPVDCLRERGRAEQRLARPDELVRHLLADDLGEAADEAGPAADGAHQRPVPVQVGVEVTGPVVPELVGVGGERRHPDVGPLERRLGVAGVEVGRVVQVGEDLARDPEVGENGVGDRVRKGRRRQRQTDERLERLGHRPRRMHGRLRRVRGPREDVDHLARRRRIRVGEAEGTTVETLEVGDVVHRPGDEVDRDDVDLATADAGHRRPGRERLPDPPDQLEEVVGTVDLVHLAGLGVADDDPRPVDAPRPLALAPDDALGLVLGRVVGVVVDVGRLVEHVLAPRPLVEAGGSDRADHVEAARLEALGELHRVARALDVGDPLRLGVGLQVVDRGEVEEVVDLADERLGGLVGDPEAPLREIADHGNDPPLGRAPARDQLLEAAA